MTETNAEWSAIDFINKTITSENGFTATLINAVEEVIYKAERVQELEDHQDRWLSGRNVAVNTYNELRVLNEDNKRLKKALFVAFAHAVDSGADGTIDVITDTLQGLDFANTWDADCEKGEKLFEEWFK